MSEKERTEKLAEREAYKSERKYYDELLWAQESTDIPHCADKSGQKDFPRPDYATAANAYLNALGLGGNGLQNLFSLCDTAGTQSAQTIPLAIDRSSDQDVFDDEYNTRGKTGLARQLGSTN